MFKICSLEIKKLLSRIEFYIFITLLAGVLIVSAFVFKPEVRKDTSIKIAGETVNEVYDKFNKIDGIKESLNASINNVTSSAEVYIKTDVKSEINILFKDLDNNCFNFNDKLNTISTPAKQELVKGIIVKLENLATTINNYLEYTKNQTEYYILVTEYDYTALYSTINLIRNNFSADNYAEMASNYCDVYSTQLKSNLSKLIYPELKETASQYRLNSHLNHITTLRLDEINQKIINLNTDCLQDNALNNSTIMKNKITTLINNYINVVNLYTEGYSSAMCSKALSGLNNSTRKDLIGYSNVLLHEQEDKAIINEYCILHNLNPENYSKELSASHTSNYTKNSYDYSYFAISMIAILVTIFAIYMSSVLTNDNIGKLRMIAIRPIKRSKIFFGKYLATILVSLTALLISLGIAITIGGFKFGFDTNNILMVINSQFVVIMHPMIAIAIYMFSLLIIVAIYTALALTLTTFIKNKFIVLSVILAFYVFNTTLPIFFDVYSWLRFYPFANINLMAFFSGNRLTNNSVIAKLFNSEIYFGMNIWISLSYILIITTLVLAIGKIMFRKKDL